MRIFFTGTSGYIGGSIGVALAAAGHEVSGLVRSERSAELVRAFGITPVHGTLDDADVLRAAAARADAVINAANADHEPSAQALLGAIEGTGKAYIHTSKRSPHEQSDMRVQPTRISLRSCGLHLLLGIPILGEWPKPIDWMAISLISAGVYIVSGGPLPRLSR
jgi:NAD(P)-dependent dehydrogenase (short-subunit alcohol dehydrogenase family)